MKTLILIRHAKSSWKHPDLSDFDRPLNHRGKSDAPMMAARLNDRSIQPEIILSSPANRALTTAQHFANTLGIPDDAIQTVPTLYMQGISAMLSVIQNLADDCHTAALFAHNPDITGMANFLSNTYVDNIPTCGIFCMEMKITTWREVAEHSGTVLFFDYPKRIAY
ncbi:histidine phosphatase family protein [candidate division KSB1 bacterium]|nr:histidine phosphatase family protein [candidate division KSB1 bacterium]